MKHPIRDVLLTAGSAAVAVGLWALLLATCGCRWPGVDTPPHRPTATHFAAERGEASRSATSPTMTMTSPTTTPLPAVTLTWTNPPDDFWHVETLPENYAVRQLNWQTGVAMSQDLCAWSEIWVSGYTDVVSVTVPVSSQAEFYRAFNRWNPQRP